MASTIKDNKIFCYISETPSSNDTGIANKIGIDGMLSILENTEAFSPKTPQAAASVVAPKSKTAADNSKSSDIIAMADYMLMAEVNRVTSNIGKWTGNSNIQSQMNIMKQASGLGIQAMRSPQMAIVSSAMTLTFTALDYSRELKFSKADSERKLIRAGYSSSGEIVGRRHK